MTYVMQLHKQQLQQQLESGQSLYPCLSLNHTVDAQCQQSTTPEARHVINIRAAVVAEHGDAWLTTAPRQVSHLYVWPSSTIAYANLASSRLDKRIASSAASFTEQSFYYSRQHQP
jgi:hypothetical protein